MASKVIVCLNEVKIGNIAAEHRQSVISNKKLEKDLVFC